MKDTQGRFQVYGRTRYEQPLTLIKEIVVKQSVKEETLAAVGDDGWVELIAVPTNALLHVTGKEDSD